MPKGGYRILESSDEGKKAANQEFQNTEMPVILYGTNHLFSDQLGPI